MGGNIMTPPHDPSSPLDGGIRKRVCKACDRCRLKKSKCDGSSPCSRCKADNAICVFGERKKSHDKVYPKGYVEMLENQQSQLVAGLQELYKRAHTGEGWSGPPLKETTHGTPLTHDILDRLGALKQDGHHSNESFEEDLDLLQQRLIANGAGMMKREPSHDGSSDDAPSPLYVPSPQRPKFSNPFPTHQYPPTPPNHSPYPQSVRAIPRSKAQMYPQTQSSTHSNLHLSQPTSDFDDGMEFVNSYDASMDQSMDQSIDFNSFPMQMFSSPDQMQSAAINPFLTMKDWSAQEDFQRYVNPAMI